jgi:peptidyl-dipeptidase Dcp
MKFSNLAILCLSGFVLAGCSGKNSEEQAAVSDAADEIAVSDAELAGNPFMAEWDTPYGVPPFADIKDEHYMPAVKKGILEMRAEIAAIVENPDAPTFDNTILAMEKAGKLVNDVANTFFNITGTELNDALQALQTEISPMLSREFDAINLNLELFERVQAVYAQKDELNLNEQQARLLELTQRGFIRSGAAFPQDVKDQITDINAEIAGLTTKFGLNLLAATKGYTV